MSQKPVPIIVVGQNEDVGRGSKEALEPDYEVVSFIRSKEACVAEIPSILGGKAPPSPSSTVGTGNLADRPVAIVVGGGFAGEAFDNLRDAVEDACGSPGSGLVWLKYDTSKPGPQQLGPEFPRAIATRVREVLGGIVKDGKAQNVEASVHFY